MVANFFYVIPVGYEPITKYKKKNRICDEVLQINLKYLKIILASVFL